MNLHRLDLVSLALFARVARTGSISRGAELMHLAVGAASKRISDLEHAVGADLLERPSRGVTLTLAGEALHRHAQRILADVDQLAADLSDHAAGFVGAVRLSANTSAVTQFLPTALAGFDAGATAFDASLGGLGGCPYAPGASGNVCTEEIAHALALMGYDTGIDLGRLIATARRLPALVGHDIPSQLTKAGQRLDLHPRPA